MLTDWHSGLNVDEFHQAVFDGKILRIQLPEVEEILAKTRAIAEQAFGVSDPQSAEQDMEPETYRAAVKAARLSANADPGINQAWHGLLETLGFDLNDTYGDRLRLRIVPSQRSHHGLRHQPLPAHRDSWGSGFEAQVNWWLPLYPLATTRTMIVWPKVFEQPLQNNSGEWSLEEFHRHQHEGLAYPLLPSARDDQETASAQPILISPGEILAFSAAHLHASASDKSGISRFSMDTRTLRRSDVAAERGAPNVDNRLRERQFRWFKQMTTGSDMVPIG